MTPSHLGASRDDGWPFAEHESGEEFDFILAVVETHESEKIQPPVPAYVLPSLNELPKETCDRC